MALDFSQLAFALSAVSSVAVIAGAIFVVFQPWQNAKLINTTIQSGIAFSMLERIIDDSFVRRRKNVYDSMKKHGERNFEWLAKETEMYLKQKEAALGPSLRAGPGSV